MTYSIMYYKFVYSIVCVREDKTMHISMSPYTIPIEDGRMKMKILLQIDEIHIIVIIIDLLTLRYFDTRYLKR